MNADVKAKWLTALRSGEYRKARRHLRNWSHTGYCCLGVLCEVAVAEGVIDDYSGADSYPPAIVTAWAGIGSNFETAMHELFPLARINDQTAGYGAAIALIEAKL